MIYKDSPTDWKDLQSRVARLFEDCGYKATIERKINTSRGSIKIDVYVSDNPEIPDETILCECKYWKKHVPKSVIHSFRSVVQDTGANFGYIISMKGYQSGAFNSATFTNLKLSNGIHYKTIEKNSGFAFVIKILKGYPMNCWKEFAS